MMTTKLHSRLGAGLLALAASPLALAAGPAMDAAEKQPLNLHAIGMFVLFVLVLQQLDGNIIGPKILGNTTSLGPRPKSSGTSADGVKTWMPAKWLPLENTRPTRSRRTGSTSSVSFRLALRLSISRRRLGRVSNQ